MFKNRNQNWKIFFLILGIIITAPLYSLATTLYEETDGSGYYEFSYSHEELLGSFTTGSTTSYLNENAIATMTYSTDGVCRYGRMRLSLSTSTSSAHIFENWGDFPYTDNPATFESHSLNYGSTYRTLSPNTTYYLFVNFVCNGSYGRIKTNNIGDGVTANITDAHGPTLLVPFYSQIKNAANSSFELYSAPDTSSVVLKVLPQDWVVYVASTTDNNSNPIIEDEYLWYQVSDHTDGTTGWMIGQNASGTIKYLPYTSTNQAEFASSSSAYIATSSRPDLILDAIDHYYNNDETNNSLYSSDDDLNNISLLKDRGYEEKVVWGIAAQESGPSPYYFDNENVSFDYGHGIMQITFNAWFRENQYGISNATWDNRGVASNVKLVNCDSIGSSEYLDCYTDAGTGNFNPKPYKHFAGNSNNPKYKQYTNTKQSIYSNIKDGMEVLRLKYNNFSPIATSTVINGISYSAVERETILATEGYNGECGYVEDVANKLSSIDTYFPNATTSDITTLIQKMDTAGDEMICAQLHSPGELSIEDSKGRVVGIVEGEGKNQFPMAIYDRDKKFSKVLFPEDVEYTFKVDGTGTGVYGLDIILKEGDREVVFKARNIPITPRANHTYSVDKNKLFAGQEGVTIKVDENGDGVIDQTLMSDEMFTGSEYGSGYSINE